MDFGKLLSFFASIFLFFTFVLGMALLFVQLTDVLKIFYEFTNVILYALATKEQMAYAFWTAVTVEFFFAIIEKTRLFLNSH